MPPGLDDLPGLAAQPEPVTRLPQVVQRMVAFDLLEAARPEADEGHRGTATLIQRFGSAANWSVHLHCLLLGGVYRRDEDGAPNFRRSGRASIDDELHALLQTIIVRLMKPLTRRRGGLGEGELVHDGTVAEHGRDSEVGRGFACENADSVSA